MKTLNLKFMLVQETYPAEKPNHLLLWGETEVLACHFPARSVSEYSLPYSQTSFNISAGKQIRARLTADFQGK